MNKNLKIIFILFFVSAMVASFGFFIKSQNSNFKKTTQRLQIINQLSNMFILSPAFLNGNQIPDKYGCHGQDINPPLEFSGVLQETKSLVLIVDDPDAPSGDWVHWLVFNINPQIAGISENAIPAGATVGLNSFGNEIYEGPCPSSGTHRYHFKLYALDTFLNLSASAEKSDVLLAMDKHILTQADLMGTYSR